MIPLNQENHLGQMAFIIFFLRRAIVSVALLIIGLVLMAYHDQLLNSAVNTMGMVGDMSGSGTNAILLIVTYSIAAIFVLAIVTFIASLIISWLEYLYYSYTFEEFNLKVKRGILNKEVVSIPYRQMQNVNVYRSLLYLLLGVSRVVIDSAGHEEEHEQSQSDIILEPIQKDVAEEIRLMLDRKIGVQVVEEQEAASKEINS
jgi:uncharacterized membrane protein YdbT with pleckstrin-like domain